MAREGERVTQAARARKREHRCRDERRRGREARGGRQVAREREVGAGRELGAGAKITRDAPHGCERVKSPVVLIGNAHLLRERRLRHVRRAMRRARGGCGGRRAAPVRIRVRADAVHAHKGVCARAREDDEATLDRTEQTPPACIVRVLAEQLHASGHVEGARRARRRHARAEQPARARDSHRRA